MYESLSLKSTKYRVTVKAFRLVLSMPTQNSMIATLISD